MARVIRHPVFGVLILLVTYVAFNTVIERLTHLPTGNFFAKSLVLEFIWHGGWQLGFAIAATAILSRFKNFFASWDEIEHGNHIRIYVLILTITLAWPLVTTGHNFYFDQSYFADKVLLLILLPLVYWRPAFILAFAVPAYLLLWQLGEPSLGGSVLAHKLQVIRAIDIFAAAFIVFAVTGNRESGRFLVLSCSFVAAAYWVPAVTKFGISWFGENHLYFMPINAYAHGWMAFLPAGRIVEISQWLVPFDWLMKLFVIVIESLFLVMLVKRAVSIGLLWAVIVFHMGVFALYGFFFWTWILLDLALLYLILMATRDKSSKVFGGQLFFASVVLIVFGSWWAMPPKLAWYDTPLAYNYRIEAIDVGGHTITIDPTYFGQYSDVMTFGSFNYLVKDRKVLTGPYGVTNDLDVYKSLMVADTELEVFELERRKGSMRYDEDRAASLRRFLERFFDNRLRRSDGEDYMSSVPAPKQFWSQRGRMPDGIEIAEIAVVEYTSFFDGLTLKIIRRQELMRFNLSNAVGQ